MANKMLIDATHPEETRVVVVRGNRVEEFDYESASRKQLRGNIYLAKVTRVEPSLQAAFIEYGGNRHGFLAFSEIHPDYYQIPVADRLALIEEEERAARLADDEAEIREKRRERSRPRRSGGGQSVSERVDAPVEEAEIVAAGEDHDIAAAQTEFSAPAPFAEGEAAGASDEAEAKAETAADLAAEALPAPAEQSVPHDEAQRAAEAAEGEVQPFPILAVQDDAAHAHDAHAHDAHAHEAHDHEAHDHEAHGHEAHGDEARDTAHDDDEPHDGTHGIEHAGNVEIIEDDEDDDEEDDDEEEEEVIENLGAEDDALEEVPERAPQRRARSYKIQEVIRRRQVMLVQVVKEERGNKGAALTTYLSLAGRYSVLMPNTARGGGISRKITNAVDRKRLKEVVQDLEVPEGMGIILRTAGANRNRVEIKRDFEYLLRLWETVRELTLSSSAPSLVYEEGSLIKRAIRDLFNKDIDEIQVAGEAGYKEARDFMRMLMPSHAKSVVPYRESQPIFARYGVEHQLDAMFSPVVQLRSGGYIVINPTEALVSIDVNSGRATREHHIEDTALKTNLEAAEEIARQLRLRDLAGLIVIDFIDMEEKRNNRAVERKLKDCLKDDRARIQIGRISHFGLMEMSRQRIRTGVLESSIEVCPVCGGTGHVRSASSVALQLLRALEEQLLRSTTHNLVARTRSEVALYVLNHKRAHLRELEERFAVTLIVMADDEVTGHQPFLIEKGELAVPPPAAPRPNTVIQPDSILPEEEEEMEDEEEILDAEGESDAAAEEGASERADDGGRKRRRRRRRRRGERDGDGDAAESEAKDAEDGTSDGADDERDPRGETDADGEDDDGAEGERGDDENGERRRRRRGRRGGRRNRRSEEGDAPLHAGEEAGFGLAAREGADDEALEEVPSALTGEPDVPPVLLKGDVPEVAHQAQDTVHAAHIQAARLETHGEDLAPAATDTAKAAPAEAPAATLTAPAQAQSPALPATPPRRRSTVREKAPVIVSEDGAIAPPPAVEAPAAVEAAQVEEEVAPAITPLATLPLEAPAEPAKAPEKPKSGWWQRKLFGG